MSGFASLGSFLTPDSSGEDVGKIGSAFCGGVIGKDRKKMCTMGPGECLTARHKINIMNYNDFPMLRAAGTDHGVFIETLDAKAVYIASHVPLTALGDATAYLDMQRTVPQWEQFLTGLRASVEAGELPTEAERSAFFKHVSDAEGFNTSKTPFKKRRVIDPVSSPAAGEVRFSSSDDDEFMGYVVKDLDPVNTIPMILKEWPVLVDNMNMLQGMLATCRETLKDFAQETAKDLREVDFSLSAVANAVGVKPEDMAAGSIFELLQSLEHCLADRERLNFTQQHSDDLGKVIAVLKGIDPKAAPLKTVIENLTRDIGSALQPLLVLLSTVSSSAQSPGDKLSSLNRLLNHWPPSGVGGSPDLLTWVEDAERRLGNIINNASAGSGMAGSQSAGLGPSPVAGLNLGAMGLNTNWTLGGGSQPPSGFGGAQPGSSYGVAPSSGLPSNTGGSSTPQVSPLVIASMQRDISDLKAQAVLSSVSIGGEVFKSLDQVTSWMALHAPGEGAHVGFVDATGLMAICYRDQTTSMDHAKLSSLAGKGGFVNIADTKLDFSFSLELPQFWGKDGTQNVHSSDVRVLPNVRDYSEWNGVGGVGGARSALTQWIEHDMDNVRAGIDVGGSREARLVSDEMVRESRSFLAQLSTWITSQYLALLDKGHKEKNAWEVISRTVRAVFKELARARSAGRGFPTAGAGRSEAQVWACLQGVRVQRDFLTAKFSAHRAVICILHDYLMDTSVTKTAHEEALAAQEARLMSVINNKMAGINRGNRNG